MNTIKVIPYRTWVNSETGKLASIYGACPYWGDDPGPWKIGTRGWTWEKVSARGNVTVGLCRAPSKTYEEAVEIAEKFAEATGAKIVETVREGARWTYGPCSETMDVSKIEGDLVTLTGPEGESFPIHVLWLILDGKEITD